MRPSLRLRRHLLTDSGLVVLLHLVQAITVQVEHKDSKATHDLRLPICGRRLRAASCQVHLSTDLIDLFVAELYLPPIVSFARIETNCLVAGIFFLLVDGHHALRILLNVQVPGIVNLFESALFELASLNF